MIRFQHLHTHFLLPFSIDKEAVCEDHMGIWARHPHWITGVTEWLNLPAEGVGAKLVERLGKWKRTPYTRYDIDSPAYQDMVFFHSYVRRVFFDTTEPPEEGQGPESLLQFYQIPLEEQNLWFVAEDAKGRSASVRVTDLRLHLYANTIGVLSIGVEAFNISASEGLWINEMMRKVYPSSRRQLREGRMPVRLAFVLEDGQGQQDVLVEERFERAEMVSFHPPLAATIRALLYFADYEQQEYEPVLDERMVVYTYVAVDPATIPEGFVDSREYEVLRSRILYVDRWGEDFRYDTAFTKKLMLRQQYRRWAHQGTWYGSTTYSNVTCCIGQFDCDEHELAEGFLIHRMYRSRYLAIALITLFYRVTLLDFAERTALVSRQLYRDAEGARISSENIRLASELRSDFLHFSNYWYFDELANKDEESEHFRKQVHEYRIDVMKNEIEVEIDKLNESLHNYYQFRNTEAVNRLAMLSLILGAGAVVTGFFGMNFSGAFGQWVFQPSRTAISLHWVSLSFVILFATATLLFGAYVVASNWRDYRESLLPRWWLARTERGARSLKRS
ncbi:MAG: CorA family divalent cation transporter [Bryobacteraceae bacterium]